MWLDAIVTSADLRQVVDQLTPATVPLGERGHLFFDAPAEVSLVADRGLRVRCHAKLLWPVLGIDVAITVRSMTLLLVPSVESRDGERVIILAPEVDALDLAVLPDIGDAELRAFINRELQEKRIELPWNYQRTLDQKFNLPDWFRSKSTFDIRSNGASVKITNDSIGLAIGFTASVEEREAPSPPSQPPHEISRGEENGAWAIPKAAPSKSALVPFQNRQRLLRLGAAVLTGFSIGCLAGFWRTSRS